jgi:polar amino acid transport system ATP-binding protein
MQPKVILFDEVTSALDPELKEEVLRVMSDLAGGGMTMILVTHEMSFAKQVGDLLVFMHNGQIWEQGPPKELFAAPKTAELKQFISSIVSV